MAKYLCPSCGEAFNGKKCKSCEYEVFGDLKVPALHGRREGTETPAHRPAPTRKDAPFGGGNAPKSGKSRKPNRVGVLVLICLLLFIVPIVEFLFAAVWSVGGFVDGILDSFSLSRGIPEAPPPEPELSPTAQEIYSSESFTVWADWEKGTQYRAIPVVVENRTDRAVTVYAGDILLHGNFLLGEGFLHISAYPEWRTGGNLYLDGLLPAGIEDIQQVSFRLHFYDSDTYDPICDSGTITLGMDNAPPAEEPEGTPLIDADGLRVYYLGLSGRDSEAFIDRQLYFCLVNDTDQYFDFFTESAQVNGQDTDLRLRSVLPPHTMTNACVYLYDLEELGITTREQVEQIQMHLQAYEESGTLGDYGTMDLPAFTITLE